MYGESPAGGSPARRGHCRAHLPKQRVIRYRESGCAVHQSNHTKSAQFPVIAVLKLSATRCETQHNSTNRNPEACKH